MKSLPSISEIVQRIHGLKPINVLKMDIEFSEWEVIPSLIESGLTNNNKQIAIKIHFHPEDTYETFTSYYRKLRVLEKAVRA